MKRFKVFLIRSWEGYDTLEELLNSGWFIDRVDHGPNGECVYTLFIYDK